MSQKSFKGESGGPWLRVPNLPNRKGKDPASIIAFERKFILPRKPTKVAHDAITSLIDGDAWHLSAELRLLLLDPLRLQQARNAAAADLKDCDVWRVNAKSAYINDAFAAIKAQQADSHASGLEMSFDTAYECMRMAFAISEERFSGPLYFFCTIPGKTDIYVVEWCRATVTPDYKGAGDRQYKTQFVNAFKLAPFVVSAGACIIVPEDGSNSIELALHVRKAPAQLTHSSAAKPPE